ncbi:MAG TPA: FAD-dependent oxidoreductase [Longimicrobiales bacterium]|nr:FAD-dependent oxidoreductase [Longimicrobiales bacterium]
MTADVAGRRVAVVGAGPAGLSAAWALADAGVSVTVLEAQSRAGGLLRTDVLDGARVDVGVQLVGSPHTSLFELARRAGAGDLLRRSPGHDALWRRGRAQGITYGSISSMVASGALPTTLKLKLAGRYIPYLKLHSRHLDVNDPAGLGERGEHAGRAALHRESIGAWGSRELGDDFVELLVYPLLAAYYGALPEETSAGVYHALAKVGMDVSVYGVAGGFGALADALVGALESRGGRVVTGRTVKSVAPAAGGGVEVDGEAFDGAVLAVPANRAAALLDAGGPLGAWLGAVRERSTLSVAYRLDRRFPGDWFGLSFPRTSEPGARIAAVCVQSRKLPGMVTDGDAVVVLPAPGALALLEGRTDGEVADGLLRDLEAAIPGVSKRVTQSRVYRFADAYTLFDPAHVRRLRAFDGNWLAAALALAGDYMAAPSVEGAVRSGLRSAQRVLSALSGGGRAR